MAHYKIFGQDPYWMNFYGLMILTLIEVAAVGLDLTEFAESYDTTEKVVTLWILTIIAIPKFIMIAAIFMHLYGDCLLYTSPSPRDRQKSRMPSSA